MNYEDLEQKVVDAIEEKPVSFAQDDSFGFEQTLGIGKNLIGMSIGGAFAGTVSGLISGVLPINVGIAGVPAIIGGVAAKKLLKAKGMLGDVADGLIVAGLSETISSLVGGSLGALTAQPERPQVEESSNTLQGVMY